MKLEVKEKKTSERQDSLIIRTVKKHPFITSTQMKNELDLPIATYTIRYRMIEANLRARRPRKVPMLKTVHMKNEPDTVWPNILWSDETKVVQFGADRGKSYVRRFPKTELNNKFTLKTIKH